MRCSSCAPSFDAPPLGVLDLAVDLLERLRHRREQILDRLLARVDVAGRLGARLAQPRFGEMEKRFVVGLERLGAQRRKRVAEPRFGVCVGLQPFGVDGAIALQLRPHAGEDGTANEPCCNRSNDETNCEVDQFDKAHRLPGNQEIKN